MAILNQDDITNNAIGFGTGTMPLTMGITALNKLKGPSVSPSNYQVSPEMRQAMEASQKQAQDFRANIGGYKDNQFNQASNESRKDLSSRLSDIKSQSNSRGLLYSGLRQAGEAGAGAQASAGLAGQRAQINQGAEQQAQGLENSAIKNGLAYQQAQQAAADYNAQQQQKANDANKKGLMSMTGALGGIIGAGAGSAGR